MSFPLVPHQVSDTAATIWVGALDEENVRWRGACHRAGRLRVGGVGIVPARRLEVLSSGRSLVAPGVRAQGSASQKNPRLPAARGGETAESSDLYSLRLRVDELLRPLRTPLAAGESALGRQLVGDPCAGSLRVGIRFGSSAPPRARPVRWIGPRNGPRTPPCPSKHTRGPPRSRFARCPVLHAF
jgi:hypothetical protein